jgi:hypothetical protein
MSSGAWAMALLQHMGIHARRVNGAVAVGRYAAAAPVNWHVVR